jgi:hypothetical protein
MMTKIKKISFLIQFNFDNFEIIRKKKQMEYSDFRSDTVTEPTPKMREAIFNSAVGDDIYGDDPTVIEL